jgi:NDP-sugar pyrophosphorylase family protein
VVTVDVRAIIVVGTGSTLDPGAPTPEQFAGSPFPLADVLGQPLVFRVIDRLRQNNIQISAVITEAPTEDWPLGTANYGNWIASNSEQLWRCAEQSFTEASHQADTILVLRLGGYTEIDYNDLLQYHTDCGGHITSVLDEAGDPLDVYVFSASRRNEAAYLFRHQLRQFRKSVVSYHFGGYVNRLRSTYDFRQLSIDALMTRIELKPDGEEIKPGVWVGRGAQVHRRARVLSPAFIGAGSRVRAAAVVTRCTALEHHTVVDCGTVVENVSTLPFTYLGAGLDVAHSLVGHSRLFHLKRGVEVEFSDPRLVGEASGHAPLRALGSLLALASFFPAQFLRGLFAPSHRECPTSLPDAISAPAAALEVPAKIKASAPAVDAGEFPSNLVIARRYGNE